MSAVVVVVIDGVMARNGELLPMAQPDPIGMRLVKALAHEFTSIAYLTIADQTLAREWLAMYDAPVGIWIQQCAPDERAFTVAAAAGQRGDRVALFIDNDTTAFEELSLIQVPVMLYHSAVWTLGDWRPKSSWSELPTEEAPVDERSDSYGGII